jgi:hypothetical protein
MDVESPMADDDDGGGEAALNDRWIVVGVVAFSTRRA